MLPASIPALITFHVTVHVGAFGLGQSFVSDDVITPIAVAVYVPIAVGVCGLPGGV